MTEEKDFVIIDNEDDLISLLQPPKTRGRKYLGTARKTRKAKFPTSKFIRQVDIKTHQKNTKHKLPGRNKACMCGSELKYKNCCGK